MMRASGGAMMATMLFAAPLHAGEAITGRWAADPSACEGSASSEDHSPFVVTASAVRWMNESCRIARMYRTGDTVHLQAICPRAGGERSIPVQLRPQGGRLLVRWDRGTSTELHRCRSR